MDERPDFTGEQRDEFFMRQAIDYARRGAAAGEVPVGALLTVGAKVLAGAHNAPIASNDPTAHAEMLVLREAASIRKHPERSTTSRLFLLLAASLFAVAALADLIIRVVITGRW